MLVQANSSWKEVLKDECVEQRLNVKPHSLLKQRPGSHGGRGSEGVGLPIMSVLGALRVFHCVPFIRLIRSCFGAALGFKTRGNKKVLRIYGFEGESGGRGGWGRASPNQIIAGERESLFFVFFLWLRCVL